MVQARASIFGMRVIWTCRYRNGALGCGGLLSRNDHVVVKDYEDDVLQPSVLMVEIGFRAPVGATRHRMLSNWQ